MRLSLSFRPASIIAGSMSTPRELTQTSAPRRIVASAAHSSQLRMVCACNARDRDQRTRTGERRLYPGKYPTPGLHRRHVPRGACGIGHRACNAARTPVCQLLPLGCEIVRYIYAGGAVMQCHQLTRSWYVAGTWLKCDSVALAMRGGAGSGVTSVQRACVRCASASRLGPPSTHPPPQPNFIAGIRFTRGGEMIARLSPTSSRESDSREAVR